MICINDSLRNNAHNFDPDSSLRLVIPLFSLVTQVRNLPDDCRRHGTSVPSCDQSSSLEQPLPFLVVNHRVNRDYNILFPSLFSNDSHENIRVNVCSSIIRPRFVRDVDSSSSPFHQHVTHYIRALAYHIHYLHVCVCVCLSSAASSILFTQNVHACFHE